MVNVPDAADALPASAGAPTSAELHGAGKVCAIAAVGATQRNTTAVISLRKFLIQLLHRSGIEQSGCRKCGAGAGPNETAKVETILRTVKSLPFPQRSKHCYDECGHRCRNESRCGPCAPSRVLVVACVKLLRT